jgi:hypothetical protein
MDDEQGPTHDALWMAASGPVDTLGNAGLGPPWSPLRHHWQMTRTSCPGVLHE